MSRFFAPSVSVQGDEIVITGKEAHHIADVMRLAVSDDVVVFDGTGTEYAGVIRQITSRSVIVTITGRRRLPAEGQVAVTLIQAVTKKDKMDYIVEKGTELGIDTIVPVMAERTIPQWTGKKADAHLERWRAIAKEASKQCGRHTIPAIEGVTDLSGALRFTTGCRIKILAALVPDARPLKDVLREAGKGDIALAIGPEGDFTKEEVALAAQANFSVISLGQRVLKSDTAGLALLAMINYAFSR
jgi:16S rRNA (uracil1498-N3)-methyltransferase